MLKIDKHSKKIILSCLLKLEYAYLRLTDGGLQHKYLLKPANTKTVPQTYLVYYQEIINEQNGYIKMTPV